MVQQLVSDLIGAARLHSQGITGKGVNVAVIDTGWWTASSILTKDTNGKGRVVAEFNALTNKEGAVPNESYGHGTDVTSVIMGSQRPTTGATRGWASHQRRVVVVTAFDGKGAGTMPT